MKFIHVDHYPTPNRISRKKQVEPENYTVWLSVSVDLGLCDDQEDAIEKAWKMIRELESKLGINQ